LILFKKYLQKDNLRSFFIKIIKDKSFQNFIIIGFISVIQLLNNVILGRDLSKEDFGVFTFVFINIIRLLSVLFLFGQNSSILRYFSKKNIEEYNWKNYLSKFNVVVLIPIILVSYILVKFYNLEFFWFSIISVGLIFKVLTTIIAPMFRSRGNFNIAVTLENADPIPFLILQILAIIIFHKSNLWMNAIMKIISFLALIPFVIYIFTKWKSGNKKIGNDIVKDGLGLWEVNITVIVLTSVDAFFIAKILNYEDLALFNIMSSIMLIFEFSRLSIFNIYSQKFSKNIDVNIRKLFNFLILIIVIITIFYFTSTKTIIYILFKGKYEISFILILLFCIYGAINILYLIPACYLIGKSTRKQMKKMSLINLSSLIIKVSLIYALSRFGLNGFLIAGITSQLFRTCGAYYQFVYLTKVK
jgi:O-antigen/teichoic acid export membrane protein